MHDEIGFSPDELQTLVHDMSYLFARSATAVSLVPPVNYAALACKRGRCYLRALMQGITDRQVTETSTGRKITKEEEEEYARGTMEEAKRLWKDGVSGPLKETMFYL